MAETSGTTRIATFNPKESRVQWINLVFSQVLVKPQNRVFFYVFVTLAY